MTIVSRRRIYWVLFLLAAGCLILSLVLALPLLGNPGQPGFLKDSKAFYRLSFLGLSTDSLHTSALAVVLSSLYGTLCLGFILSSFRKTVSPEIFFFSFWALSLAFEVLRLVVYHFSAAGAPASWVLLCSRTVFAARLLGLLCFFSAGLYAAGLRNEKLGSALGIILVVGWALAEALPFDTGVFQATLLLNPGFIELCSTLAVLASLGVVANLLYAAFSSGERSYGIIALGAALALGGQGLLTTSYQPLVILAGAVLIGLGSWLFVSRLHAYYLWQ